MRSRPEALPLCPRAYGARLGAVYHSDHRELCAHERDWPFRIMNFLEIIGASMALHHDDHFKRLKMLRDADAILADCRDTDVATRPHLFHHLGADIHPAST